MQGKQFWLSTLFWSNDVAKFCENDEGPHSDKAVVGLG